MVERIGRRSRGRRVFARSGSGPLGGRGAQERNNLVLLGWTRLSDFPVACGQCGREPGADRLRVCGAPPKVERKGARCHFRGISIVIDPKSFDLRAVSVHSDSWR